MRVSKLLTVLSAAAILTLTAGTACAKGPTYLWEFKKPDKLYNGQDGAERAATAAALSVDWATMLSREGKSKLKTNDVSNLENVSDLKKLRKGFEQVGKKYDGKPFGDAIVPIGVMLAKRDIDVSVASPAKKWKTKTIDKALKALDKGEFYLFIAFEKKSKSGFWYTAGVRRTKVGSRVMDPFVGAFQEKKAGSYLKKAAEAAAPKGTEYASFIILKFGGEDVYATIEKALEEGREKLHAEKHAKKWFKRAREEPMTWFAKDANRLKKNYSLSKDGDVLWKRGQRGSMRDFLAAFLGALGSDSPIPSDKQCEDEGSFGPWMEENWKDDEDLLYAVALITQKGSRETFSGLKVELLNRTGIDAQPANEGTRPDRWDEDKDGWIIDIAVTKKTVAVTHQITYIEGFDSKDKFKIRFIVPVEVDRKKGKLIALQPLFQIDKE